MPVPLTPTTPPVPSDNPQITPPVTAKIFGVPQVTRMRSVVVRQGQGGAVQLNMLKDGVAIDLTAWTNTSLYQTELWSRDALSTSFAFPSYKTIGEIVIPEDGLVQGPISDVAAKIAGIYLSEFLIREISSNNIFFSEMFYLVVERSLDRQGHQGGPPTLAEIRLHLRDAPEGNRLLDEYEFDPAEIAAAISRCIMWFNEVEPPINAYYSTNTFPWRYHWMDGIVAELFTTAAHYYRRNKFNYTAGGVQVSSIDKEGEYSQAAQFHRERWETWARRVKVRANIDAGFLTTGNGYGRDYYGV